MFLTASTPETLWLVAALMLQVALTLAIILYLGFIRVPLIVRGEVSIRKVALSREAWPDREKQVSNALDNQFQLPLLFLVAALVALMFGATAVEAVLAWLFVISRYAHAFIHLTDNHVIRRFWAYVAGFVVLCMLWLDLAIRLIARAAGAS
jgi:hypothetical protein